MGRVMITRNHTLLCSLLVISFVLNPTVLASASHDQAIFVFGDSLFDAGNNPHYRPDQYFPTLHYPFGMSVNGPTGRLSDGLLVPDILAKHAGLAPVPPCLGLGASEVPMTGCNTASAGSGAQDHHPNVLNLREQIKTFKEMVGRIEGEVGDKNQVREMLNKAVFLLSVGGNDYFSFSTNNRNATDAEIDNHVQSVLSIIMEALNEIYEMGGRKFAFQDVGPLGCYPTFKLLQGLIHGCDDFALKVASYHNLALRRSLHIWSRSFPFTDIKYGVFDYFNQLQDRMAHPTKYDFLVGDMACCGGYGGYLNGRGCGRGMYFLCSNPSAFVLFDGAHTTEKLNGQLADLMWSGDLSVIAPYNVRQLFQHDSSNLKLLHEEGEI